MEAAERHSLGVAEMARPHERLRLAVIAYMESERIGVTELQSRIAKKGVSTLKAVTLDNLMLFLAGRKAPEPELQRVCKAVLETAGQSGTPGVFGDALITFGQCVTDRDALAGLAGSYAITAFVEPVAGSEFMEGVRAELEYGQIDFELVDDKPYLRAVMGEPDEDADGQAHYAEGVAVRQAHGITVWLRDMLTRRLTVMMLNAEPEGGDARLTGAVMRPGFDGRSAAGASVMDISLRPATAGQG